MTKVVTILSMFVMGCVSPATMSDTAGSAVGSPDGGNGDNGDNHPLAAILWYQFLNVGTNLCMGVNGGSMVNGQGIIQWACESSLDSPDQFWQFLPTTAILPCAASPLGCYYSGYFQIQNYKNPSFCLVGDVGSLGSQLSIGYCNDQDGNFSDIWKRSQIQAPYWVLQPATSYSYNPVAAAWEDSKAEGTPVIVWYDEISNQNPHYEQQWNLRSFEL